MGPYLKKFIFASLVYLGVAVIFGVLNGVTDIGYAGYFAHTHFNLLGFMSMMIFGIGYFILPRFNGVDLKFEGWVPLHFWLGNLSLIGMVFFRGLEVTTGEDFYAVLFVIFASVQALTIFMFILNIWLTLAGPQATTAQQSSSQTTSDDAVSDSATAVKVHPQSKIAELVDLKPSILDLLINGGLASLRMPGHLDKVRQMGITIEMACNNHGLDMDGLILSIEKELSQQGLSQNRSEKAVAGVQKPTPTVSTDLLIGDVIASHPSTRVVFQKYFGDGCFDCPGQSYESIDMACRMHGVDPELFLSEIKAVL